MNLAKPDLLTLVDTKAQLIALKDSTPQEVVRSILHSALHYLGSQEARIAEMDAILKMHSGQPEKLAQKLLQFEAMYNSTHQNMQAIFQIARGEACIGTTTVVGTGRSDPFEGFAPLCKKPKVDFTQPIQGDEPLQLTVAPTGTTTTTTMTMKRKGGPIATADQPQLKTQFGAGPMNNRAVQYLIGLLDFMLPAVQEHVDDCEPFIERIKKVVLEHANALPAAPQAFEIFAQKLGIPGGFTDCWVSGVDVHTTVKKTVDAVMERVHEPGLAILCAFVSLGTRISQSGLNRH